MTNSTAKITMATGVMISQLGSVSEIEGTDMIEIERSGASYCATIDELVSYIGLDEFAEALSDIIG